LTVTNNLPPVRVQIRVSNQNVLVTPGSFHSYVDLYGLGPGLHTVKVHVVADPGITVVQVRPASVRVQVEAIKVDHVRVTWRILGAPPTGYTAGAVRVDPTTVTLSGPSSILAQVASARVYIDLSEARSSLNGPYQPSLEDSQGRAVAGAGHITVEPARVEIEVPIRSLSSYKTLPVLVPIKGQPKTGVGVVGVTVNPAEITAVGQPYTLGTTSSVHTAPVSVAARGPGKFVTHARLQLPSGVQTQTHQRTVAVTVQLAPVSVSSSIEIGISPENVAGGLVAHTRPATVLVTVVGPASKLRGAARQMHAVVDLAGFGIGTYTLSPRVVAPPGLTIGGVYPSSVSITLEPSTSS
jgi:YbbR domain-containing protein